MWRRLCSEPTLEVVPPKKSLTFSSSAYNWTGWPFLSTGFRSVTTRQTVGIWKAEVGWGTQCCLHGTKASLMIRSQEGKISTFWTNANRMQPMAHPWLCNWEQTMATFPHPSLLPQGLTILKDFVSKSISYSYSLSRFLLNLVSERILQQWLSIW